MSAACTIACLLYNRPTEKSAIYNWLCKKNRHTKQNPNPLCSINHGEKAARLEEADTDTQCPARQTCPNIARSAVKKVVPLPPLTLALSTFHMNISELVLVQASIICIQAVQLQTYFVWCSCKVKVQSSLNENPPPLIFFNRVYQNGKSVINRLKIKRCTTRPGHRET